MGNTIRAIGHNACAWTSGVGTWAYKMCCGCRGRETFRMCVCVIVGRFRIQVTNCQSQHGECLARCHRTGFTDRRGSRCGLGQDQAGGQATTSSATTRRRSAFGANSGTTYTSLAPVLGTSDMNSWESRRPTPRRLQRPGRKKGPRTGEQLHNVEAEHGFYFWSWTYYR